MNFEQALQDNLKLYTSAPEELDGGDIFQTHREVALARYALTQQAHAYAKAVEILNTLLETAAEKVNSDPKQLSHIMVCIQSIETKSAALIDSVHRVTKLLGEIVNIDVDKAALRNMIVRLPSAVRSTIEQLSGDNHLADQIASSLSSRIDSMMVAFRFNDERSSGVNSSTSFQETETSTENLMLQYNNLINSVPTCN